jgi:uncharacterized protein (DUF362 family)/ferredoxin
MIDLSIHKCTNTQDALEKLRAEFSKRENLLPTNYDARIVIKPNLNSNLDSLTGNTTDLRVLISIIRVLKEYGYNCITIMEGPNGGFHRDGINVFARNKIDKVASYYGCKFKDVNYETDSFPIEFQESGIVQIASAFKECDFFINVPKLKTHYETLISVALKSLIGVLVGQPNKVKAHASLNENILRLNDALKPDLHIVDGLIAMEGTGPSAGRPRRTDIILVGTDAYEIDVYVCKIMSFKPEESPLIVKALETKRITDSFVKNVLSCELKFYQKPFEPPNPGLLAKLIVTEPFSELIRAVRNSAPVNHLLKLTAVRRLMLFLGISQEVIIRKERNGEIKWNEEKCERCQKCAHYCPQMLDLPEAFEMDNTACLDCMYCYAVCPTDAYEYLGDLGYYNEQKRRYGKIIKKIT